MKIRMQGNSIRLRLTQTEVGSLNEKGRVSARVKFGSGALAYSLEKTSTGEMSARFADGNITVFLPEAKAMEWATTGLTGLEHNADIGNGENLRIIVEKDFKCLTVRQGEDESDNFENPNGAC